VTASPAQKDARMIRGTESLARTPLFASLGAEDIRAIDSRCTWKKVSAGEWVIDYQSDGTDVFFVLTGHARVVIGDMILHDIFDGGYFGELSAIDGRPRSAGIVAISDTVVARMPAAVFRELVHRYPVVCDQILATFVARIRSLDNRATEQANFDVRERLCAELLRLSRATSDGRLIVSPPPTHVELASRISTHREAVTKNLSALEREGVISRARGSIGLTNPDRLRQIVTEASER
jgi:CRP/FNR family transcriptional regulator, cyclic AMP receptor protein